MVQLETFSHIPVKSECSRPTLSVFFQDCKWKMYMELDGDDVAVTYIKDVIFNANRQDVEILRMTKVSSEKKKSYFLNFLTIPPFPLFTFLKVV